jgi:hypothetical protein
LRVDFIDLFGGVRATARALGVPVTTVWHWRNNNRVPEWRRAQIEQALRTKEAFPVLDQPE